jgi:hypothetical protein
MATTKKKTFDAIASSRRWRRETSKLLSKMTSAERIAFLNRRLENWPSASKASPASVSAQR